MASLNPSGDPADPESPAYGDKNFVGRAGLRLALFFESCLAEVQEPVERALLDTLVRQGTPVSPRTAARTLGLPTIKSAADTLCCLGLICRWNLNEGATLHANCRVFNEWYLAQATGK